MDQTVNPTLSKKIGILPPLVAERIAAGEVIERPSSVVKELVENAIDAGSSQIEVRLMKGGTELIEVTDNGSGMDPEDLELSVCRHATSKIQNFEDLNQLFTLGFRGEALPSIAAVARLKITSKTIHGETHDVIVEQTAPQKASAKRTANFSFLGSTHGTRLQVSSLFSQIPARLKFLKSAGAETSAVREILERLALTHPEIAFTLISDERTILQLPKEPLEKRARRMLADDNPFELLHTRLEGPWAIEVIWLKGLSQPHTRSIYQIVNGRALRDRIVQQAVLSPLRQSFLPGNFPSLVVKLDIPADEIDVNAHPTKTEIRFLDPKKIFALCSAAISKLLDDSKPAEQELSSVMTSIYSQGTYPHFTPSPSAGFFRPVDQELLSTPTTSFDTTPFGQYKGIWFSTYLAFEQGDEILLIDQHAAHERIRYEKLKQKILNHDQIEEQELLVPEVIKMDSEKVFQLREKLDLLKSLGFDSEAFSEESILFRTVPAVWGMNELTPRLRNLLERLHSAEILSENPVWDEVLFEKVAMEACRSSFKAGDHLNEWSAIDLTRKLMECKHPGNCPHGRVTFIKIHKSKVEEWFNRKV